MKILKEWFIRAPWGKVALISWGNPNGEPILLVHGRQDSVATFIPLLEHLPDNYHYVAVDMPGNGLSDPLPVSVMLTRFFPVVVIDMVVEHLNWDNFTFIAHSMGTEQGLFYNAIYPGKFKKCIYLDGAVAIRRLLMRDFSTYYKTFYYNYYNNYSSINTDDRVFSKDKALKAVMKARNLTKEQAEIILSRNLKRLDEDQYRLSWDKRQRILAPSFNSLDYYYELFSQNAPPTLHILASQSNKGYAEGKESVNKLMSDLETNVPNIRILTVHGEHDVHFTNPERVARLIISFLEEDNGKRKSKL
ncbi:unnamed protein product [Parnassius mnemosyne]|uniref:AB hydrolase-1 domain-containing protein n=1 Tax=Parnassius mnemosyne TaxID=213953 RepID=A0AAV1KYR0_9NEOP